MKLSFGIRMLACGWPSRLPRISAVLLLASTLSAPETVLAHGDAGHDVIEHFDQHFDEFEPEVEHLAREVDAIVVAHREGKPVADLLDGLIDHWEQVQVHEAIETKAVHLYPPIWQGIYAMMQAADESGNEAQMAEAGERTKGALWQGLGGLKVLAHPSMPVVEGAVPADFSAVRNDIVLTGDDDMRFDETHLVVSVGEPVTLKFKNVGELPKNVMGHNVVVLARGAEVEPFAIAAAEAGENSFIPQDERHREQIVAHTRLLGPGETDTITFTLTEPGAYPFICSFPGHFRLMQGTIQATSDPLENPITAIIERLESAVAFYEEGHSEDAAAMVLDAYIHIFEGLEGELIEHDPELVLQLELDFNAGLPGLFAEGAPAEEAVAMLQAMRARLQQARQLLAEADEERPSIF